MMQNKPFNAPLRVLVPALVLQVPIMLRASIASGGAPDTDFIDFLMMAAVWVMNVGTLLAECIFYYRFRYWVVKRVLAYCHVIGLLLAWTVPFIYERTHTIPENIYKNEEYISRVVHRDEVTGNIFITILILAHAFFVWLMIDTLRKRKAARNTQPLLVPAFQAQTSNNKEMVREQKSFPAPFYVMTVVVLVGAAYWVMMLVGFLRTDRSEASSSIIDVSGLMIRRLVTYGTIYLVLALECFLYWNFRDRIRKKDFAWGHVVGVALAMIIIPMALEWYCSATGLYNADTIEKSRQLMVVSNLHDGLQKSFLLLAHLCGAIVVMDIWKRRREKQEETQQAPDILNEYAEQ